MSRASRKKKGRANRGNGRAQQTMQYRPELFVYPGDVSHAFWPLEARRCLATGKRAQRRRLMILKGVRWFRRGWQFKRKRRQTTRGIFRIYLLYTALGISFLMTGVLLAMFMLRPWPVTMLLVLFWLATIALTVRLWYVCLQMTLIAKHSTTYKAKKHAINPVVNFTTKGPGQSFPAIAQTRPIANLLPTIPVTRPLFPSTPMPPTPLVRVLETIDLSSTNIEHFLDGGSPSDQQMPDSQLDLPSDVPASNTGRYDEYTGGRIEVHIDEEAR